MNSAAHSSKGPSSHKTRKPGRYWSYWRKSSSILWVWYRQIWADMENRIFQTLSWYGQSWWSSLNSLFTWLNYYIWSWRTPGHSFSFLFCVMNRIIQTPINALIKLKWHPAGEAVKQNSPQHNRLVLVCVHHNIAILRANLIGLR